MALSNYKISFNVTSNLKQDKYGRFNTEYKIKATQTINGKFASNKQLEALGIPKVKPVTVGSMSASRFTRELNKGYKSQTQLQGIVVSLNKTNPTDVMKSARESFVQIIEEQFNPSPKDLELVRKYTEIMGNDGFNDFYYRNQDLMTDVYENSPNHWKKNEPHIRDEDQLKKTLKKVMGEMSKFTGITKQALMEDYSK